MFLLWEVKVWWLIWDRHLQTCFIIHFLDQMDPVKVSLMWIRSRKWPVHQRRPPNWVKFSGQIYNAKLEDTMCEWNSKVNGISKRNSMPSDRIMRIRCSTPFWKSGSTKKIMIWNITKILNSLNFIYFQNKSYFYLFVKLKWIMFNDWSFLCV